MPPIVGWSIFVLLGGFFLVIATNNVVLGWRQFVLKQESTPSVLPFIGGTLGYVGLRASPVEVISNYAWLALLLDVGCGPYLVLALTFLLPEIWSTSRFNLLREYLGQQASRQFICASSAEGSSRFSCTFSGDRENWVSHSVVLWASGIDMAVG